MAGTAMAGDGFSSMAGMSKNQLYDIMCQMKALVEQNQQQAKQILVQNPNLTRALFQAQIMLGMLQPPQLIPNIQSAESRPAPRPSSQTGHSLPHSMPVQVSSQDASAYQTQAPFGKQQQNQPLIPVTSRIAPPINVEPLPMPSRVPHSPPPPRGNVQAAQPSLPQSSHFPDLPIPPPHHSGSQAFSPHQPQMSNSSLPTSGIQHLPTQPPLPQQPRPPSMPTFHHQLPPQMGPNMGFQHSGPPQMHHSQPMFHSGGKLPQNIGPLFSQGLSTLNQPPPQSGYPAVGSHMARDFNTTAGNSMHIERELPWMPGPPETTTRLPPPPPSVPSQIAPGNQLPRPPPLSAEMERSLVHQVMSLTPEQINLLPPEQRNQVFQLQQMLR